jgi:hypothetical protein
VAIRLVLVGLVLVEAVLQPGDELAVPDEREVERLRGRRGEPGQRRAHVVRVHRAEQLEALVKAEAGQ